MRLDGRDGGPDRTGDRVTEASVAQSEVDISDHGDSAGGFANCHRVAVPVRGPMEIPEPPDGQALDVGGLPEEFPGAVA